MTIHALYTTEPIFPASDQHSGAVRTIIAGYWVDYSGPVPSEPEVLAVALPDLILQSKSNAKIILDASYPDARVFIALITLIVSELNLLRDWITTFKAAVAAASSLANLQTRVAALANTPARDAPTVKQAIKDAIDSAS